MMENKPLLQMGLGAIVTFLLAMLALMAYQALIWAPMLIEIASVTWNDRPII